MSYITLTEQSSAPPSPVATKFSIYFNGSGQPFYVDSSGTTHPLTGISNPMTAQYDLIIGGTSGTPVRLAVGGNGTFLGVSGGVLGYYTPTATAAWGSITGTLSSQTDLQTALNAKGALGIPPNSQSTAYTLVLADNGQHIYHPSADTTARTWTIPANSSVAFPIGASVTFVNDVSAGAITLAITTDTLVWFPSAGTGSRTLAAGAVATALKVTSTRWILSGVGIS